MLLSLRSDLEKHVRFLVAQSPQVLQGFCTLILDYLTKGPDFRLYKSAAQRLSIETDAVKNAVEGLVHLLLKSYECKLSADDFRDSIITLGFSGENAILLCNFYADKKYQISRGISAVESGLQEYSNLEWRLEVQIAARSLVNQMIPMIVLDLCLQSSNVDDEVEHIAAQTDSNNLMRIIEELESALQNGLSQRHQKIMQYVK